MAIGDTVNAGLMRFDSSAYERAGQANAQANAAFGNALNQVARGFIEGQEKKARTEEMTGYLMNQGVSESDAKAIAKNPFLQKEYQRKKATEAQMEIEGNRLAMQARSIANQSRDASEKNLLAKEKFGLDKEIQERAIAAQDEQRDLQRAIARFQTAERDLPITPELMADPDFVPPPLDPDPFVAPPRTYKGQAPGVERLPESFQPQGQRVIDSINEGDLTPMQGNRLLGEIEARAIAEAPEAMSVSDQIKILEFQKENEPKPPQQPVYTQAALDAIEDALGYIKKDSFFNPTAGLGAETMAYFGGSDATNLEAALKTITSSIGFDRLRKMRESSKTGGALGSVSERELEQLNAALGSISQKQKPEQLEKNLKKIRTHYQNSVDALAAQKYAYENGLPQFKNDKEALDFINQYKQRGQASAQASAQASPEVLEAINQKKKLIDSRRGRLLDNTPEYKVAQ
jgi:hypothetical protein